MLTKITCILYYHNIYIISSLYTLFVCLTRDRWSRSSSPREALAKDLSLWSTPPDHNPVSRIVFGLLLFRNVVKGGVCLHQRRQRVPFQTAVIRQHGPAKQSSASYSHMGCSRNAFVVRCVEGLGGQEPRLPWPRAKTVSAWQGMVGIQGCMGCMD